MHEEGGGCWGEREPTLSPLLWAKKVRAGALNTLSTCHCTVAKKRALTIISGLLEVKTEISKTHTNTTVQISQVCVKLKIRQELWLHGRPVLRGLRTPDCASQSKSCATGCWALSPLLLCCFNCFSSVTQADLSHSIRDTDDAVSELYRECARFCLKILDWEYPSSKRIGRIHVKGPGLLPSFGKADSTLRQIANYLKRRGLQSDVMIPW